MKNNNLIHLALILPLALGAVAYVFPWDNINWGQVQMAPAKIVTVVGNATETQRNEVAEFSAGVTALNADKQTALDEVNTKSTDLIEAVKEFGILEEDIQTQNLSVNQEEDRVIELGTQRSELAQWRVNNTINIVLRDVEQAQELSDLLSQTGATNVYGPNFRLDTSTNQDESGLVEAAIENAREKAKAIANASGKELGEVVTVTEAGTSSPIMMRSMALDGAGGGGPVLPGSSQVSKSLTVTFELK